MGDWTYFNKIDGDYTDYDAKVVNYLTSSTPDLKIVSCVEYLENHYLTSRYSQKCLTNNGQIFVNNHSTEDLKRLREHSQPGTRLMGCQFKKSLYGIDEFCMTENRHFFYKCEISTTNIQQKNAEIKK